MQKDYAEGLRRRIMQKDYAEGLRRRITQKGGVRGVGDHAVVSTL